jgi:hypothetical protein
MRNEGRRAAGRINHIYKIWEVTFIHSYVAYPSPPSKRGPGTSCPWEDATA